MCGIAGIAGPSRDRNTELVATMLSHLTHRGPDQDGLWSGETAVLGHRRLSILDLSEAGRQPMVHPTTGHVMVYNGECYNYLEIRRELEAMGHRFTSTSDTEVILDAFATWGERAVNRLRGMFAIALWDPTDGSTLLVRDRLGIKPVYFSVLDRSVVYASELRALLATGLVQRSVDEDALNAYLWHGFVPGPRTIVRDVKLLPAGAMLRISADGSVGQPQTYWSLPKPVLPADAEQAREEAEEELSRAVSMRLISDVPLGVFLSGGIDSSAVAALAQRASNAPVRSFNISFDETAYDESHHARKVAERLGTDHDEARLTADYFLAGLEEALDCLDQPTFDGINTYFVSKVVREAGLTVALSGAGGDELCAGYSSFVDIPKAAAAAKLAGILPSGIRGWAAGLGARMLVGSGSEIPPQTRYGKLADILASGGNLIELYQASYAQFTRKFHDSLLARDSHSEVQWGLYPEQREAAEAMIAGCDDHSAVSLLELSSFVGQRLLRDTDTASMAVSLEVRVPLLDHVFVEKMAHVLPADRYEPLGRKTFLRRAMQPELPNEFFDRPKAGFELPLEVWCRKALSRELDDTFGDLALINRIGLDCETVQRTWRAFKKGGSGLYWSRVWSLFVLIRWCRKHQVYL